MRITIKSVATVAVIAGTAMMSMQGMAAEATKDATKSVGTLSTNRYTQALVDRMDSSKDGKVSKAEFMKFMEAEWNALDKNKNGVLETTEFVNREYFQRREVD